MHLRLREEEQAAAIARRAAASVMRGSVSVDVEMVSLLVNELVVRVLHRADRDQPVDLRLEATPTMLRVNVAAPAADRDGGAPKTPEMLSAGWTLLMIDRVADRWGVDDGRAIRVWFEVDLGPVEAS
jgi:hypothetical protein